MRSSALIVAGLIAAGCADPFFEGVTALGDTRDRAGPYHVQAVAIGVEDGDRVELHYNAVDDEPGNFIPLVMEPGVDDRGLAEPELYVRGIPGQPPMTTIRYFVAIDRDGDQVAAAPAGGDLRPFVFTVLP